MKTSTDRILTTHAGALPRPADVAGATGQADDQLKLAVSSVVLQQAKVGVDVVNDGELGKTSWTGYVNERLTGFEAHPASPANSLLRSSYDMRQFADYYEEAWKGGTLWYHNPSQLAPSAAPMEYVCTGPIGYDSAAIERDIANFKAALQDVNVGEAFLPVAAPASIEVGRRNEYYADQSAFVEALAEAMAVEYQAVVDAGLIVQIDDAWIPALWDRMLPDIGLETYKKHVMLRVEALNHALRRIPEDRVRYHLCWGSWHGPHLSDIPMQDIVDVMLQVKAGAYLFEAANVRHEHEYHVWENTKVPDGRVLIPGVVSHSTNVVEHPELVAERIIRFAQRVGRESVMAGTDCGLGGRVHPQIAWAKLYALVQGARLASERLW